MGVGFGLVGPGFGEGVGGVGEGAGHGFPGTRGGGFGIGFFTIFFLVIGVISFLFFEVRYASRGFDEDQLMRLDLQPTARQ